jgi:septation ring formation regulator EzrA
MSTDEGTSMTAKLEEVLRAIRDVEAKVDDKLSAMKREMESADDRLIKKMRLDSKPTFKKRGHEKQHQFNEQVRDKMDAAAAALEQTPPAVEKARISLQEGHGEKLINIRQKNILIADRSEHGWATVAEYEEDELADCSLLVKQDWN